MTNYNVLKAGTANAADALGLENLGRLKKGSLSDLIVFPPEASPLQDIFNTEKVKMVYKDGRLYEAETMGELLPEEKPLPPGPVLDFPSN